MTAEIGAVKGERDCLRAVGLVRGNVTAGATSLPSLWVVLPVSLSMSVPVMVHSLPGVSPL